MDSYLGKVCFEQALIKFQLISHLCSQNCLQFMNPAPSVQGKEIPYTRIWTVCRSTEIWFLWSGFTEDHESCQGFVFKADYQGTSAFCLKLVQSRFKTQITDPLLMLFTDGFTSKWRSVSILLDLNQQNFLLIQSYKATS